MKTMVYDQGSYFIFYILHRHTCYEISGSSEPLNLCQKDIEIVDT